MDKIRHISDIHCDINEKYPLELKDKDVFTVVTGDVAGKTEMGIEWIRKNVRRGIVVNGNHMPYRNATHSGSERKTVGEFRRWLKSEFPIGADVSYLDAECGDFAKEVDGILFLGSCFYSNFRVSEPTWNPHGSQKLNMACSEWNMNDYRYGYTEKTFSAGPDNEPSFARMTARDLNGWFRNAYKVMEAKLNENEASADPKPVVLATHYPLVTDYLRHNGYVERPEAMYRQRDFNWGSYASNLKPWLKRHGSIRAYLSGHIHDVEKDYRYYSLKRKDGADLLLVHNVRGYVNRGHARWFNPDTFVDTKTWTAFENPLTEAEEKERKDRCDEYLNRCLVWGCF